MSGEPLRETVDAPERYEPEADPVPHALPIRPDLFALYGEGLVVLVELTPTDPDIRAFGAWLHIAQNAQVTVFSGKAEVGQNIRTSLAQAAADELALPAQQVRMVLGDTGLTPFDMGTFGSRTTPYTAPQVRRAAAAARETLVELAARLWGIDRASLIVKSGCVYHASQQSISIAELIRGRRILRIVGQDVATRPGSRWTVAGAGAEKADGREFVTGCHKFASDLSIDGMLYGRVLRPPAFGARLKSIDLVAARAIPGSVAVREGDFVAVAGPTPGAAAQALAAIKADWDIRSVSASNSSLISLLRPEPTRFPTNQIAGRRRLGATYTVSYIAHVPLEPRAAVAEWNNDKLTVWTGTQRPFGVREELALAFGVSIDHIRVIVPDTGSGYGGKHTGEAAVEAARIAKAARKPVKVTWSREEEFTWAYQRPAGVIDITAVVRPDSTIAEWQFHNYNSGGAGITSPYNIPAQVAEFHEVESPLRQGSYRALAATANNFARDCHMDDLAHLARIDPLAFRLKNLSDDRLRAVLLAAAERFGWQSRQKSPGRGFGLACATEKGSYIANCVEIALNSDGTVKLVRIVAAFECGAIVNPLHLENQVEGAIVMGIGGALFEEIKFAGGRILNPHLSEYRVPRFSDIPPIETILLDRKDLPSAGAGETPIITIAPAIGNAIFDATGSRLRALPLIPNGHLPRKS